MRTIGFINGRRHVMKADESGVEYQSNRIDQDERSNIAGKGKGGVDRRG